METPGLPRPGYSVHTFNPNYQRSPNSLSDDMHNLQISRPSAPGSSVSRPAPFAPYITSAPVASPLAPTSLPPPTSYSGASSFSRPGPPPSGFPRAPPLVSGPSQLTQTPNLAPGTPSGPIQPPSLVSGRPSGPPFSQTAAPGRPSGPPSSQTPPNLAPGRPSGPPFSQTPPNLAPGRPSGPPFSQAPPNLAPGRPVRPPFYQPPPAGSRPPLDALSSAPMTSGPTSVPSIAHGPLTNGPPFNAPGNMPAASQYMVPPMASPYGSQIPPLQQGSPPFPGPMPPPMYGMPPPQSNQSVPMVGSVSGVLPAGQSKVDTTNIPRPFPSSSSGTTFETRQDGQANIPPPASNDYIVKDTGNCSPRYMRCTVNQIPCTDDLLSTTGMPLALMVQPLALSHPMEDQIQLVDFGEGGPVRCSRCKGYINPFMKFVDQGKRFICNFCGLVDETPRDYHCNLGPDGRRRDADQRPELCRGTVEFVATKEFLLRDPMPAVFFFLIDVSMNAIQTGATAAACSAVSQAIAELPEGPRTMVEFATFDSTIHFYNLKRVLQQPLMLIVPDVQDVYTPLQTDVIVQLDECRQHLEQLLENIPTMFESNKVAESAFCAAAKAAFLAMKSTGGKLLVFQSVLPSIGFGALSARGDDGRTNYSAGEKEVQKLLQPADKALKTMALEFAEFQVCVDIFIMSQTYVDIASISVIPSTTGGQVYYYFPFSAVSDSAKLHNDLRWNVTRPQGMEAVMRVRCTQGLQVEEYSGSFCKRIPTDVDLPAIDCDKTIMATFKHDDKLVDGSESSFQCALLYTTVYGERRIRVSTLSLPCTSSIATVFRAADLDAQFTCFLKQVANEVPLKPLNHLREELINKCSDILSAYRKFCATPSASGQLILPEGLKLLPLYTLALIKSKGLRIDCNLDDRSYWVNRVTSLPLPLAVPLVHPRIVALHNLVSDENTTESSIFPPVLPLSTDNISADGIYLIENGEDGLIYVGNQASPEILQQIFGVPSIDKIPPQFVLQQFDNHLSRKINNLVNTIRSERSSYLRLRVCTKGDPLSEAIFNSYMVEDKGHGNPSPSYVEFLVHIHRQIQTRMA